VTEPPAVEALLNAMPAHIALLDERGVIVTVNAAWKRFACGNGMASPGFGVGHDYPALCDAAGDDDAQRAAAAIRSVLRGQSPEASLEYPCHSPSEQRWFRMTATPLPGAPMGRTGTGAVVMHVDISERKRAEFAELFEQTDAFIVVLDAQGLIETVNPAFTLATGWVSTDERVRAARIPPSAPSERSSRTLRRGQVRRDGSRFDIDWTISPVFSHEGRLLSHVCIGRDATREQQVQDGLRENDKLRATVLLAGAFAHDFNNLLGSVIGLTELCAMEAPLGSRLASNLGRISQASSRAATLVRQLLDFSRQTPLTMQTLRAREWLGHAEGLLRAALPARVSLAVAFIDDASVCVDLVQMDQVLLNLCANAAHAMRHHGGTVRIEAALADPGDTSGAGAAPCHLRLRVIDHGEGIAPALLKRVFEPFFTTKPVGEGSGLGLASVQGVVSSHGGVIDVASELGVGTTFSVFLPLAPAGQTLADEGLCCVPQQSLTQ
jgi:PAS domain S-box-containing protein